MAIFEAFCMGPLDRDQCTGATLQGRVYSRLPTPGRGERALNLLVQQDWVLDGEFVRVERPHGRTSTTASRGSSDTVGVPRGLKELPLAQLQVNLCLAMSCDVTFTDRREDALTLPDDNLA
jgi:hypothetical protein